jgi:uncharacterized protein (DUF58 family)
MDRWIRRRARATPPLKLIYRQIFILPTRFGWMLGLLMFGMLLGALNFNNNLGLLTTFLVVSMAHSSLLIAYRNLRDLEVTAIAASPVHAGETAELRVSFRNHDPVERPSLTVSCLEAIDEIDLPPEDGGTASIALPTRRRGWMDIPRVEISTVHPTGLFRAWSYVWADRRVLVWPRPADEAPPFPAGGARTDGQRFSRTPEGDSFFSLRKWRPGDPLHRVAWKSSQRHGALLSREFRNEESDQIDLDLEDTPGHDMEARISILATWVLEAARGNNSWTLRAGGQVLGPDRGEAFAHRCLDHLAQL